MIPPPRTAALHTDRTCPFTPPRTPSPAQLPLLVGVVAALLFANVAPDAYKYVVGADHHGDYLSLAGDWKFLGHPLTFYFIVNGAWC